MDDEPCFYKHVAPNGAVRPNFGVKSSGLTIFACCARFYSFQPKESAARPEKDAENKSHSRDHSPAQELFILISEPDVVLSSRNLNSLKSVIGSPNSFVLTVHISMPGVIKRLSHDQQSWARRLHDKIDLMGAGVRAEHFRTGLICRCDVRLRFQGKVNHLPWVEISFLDRSQNRSLVCKERFLANGRQGQIGGAISPFEVFTGSSDLRHAQEVV